MICRAPSADFFQLYLGPGKYGISRSWAAAWLVLFSIRLPYTATSSLVLPQSATTFVPPEDVTTDTEVFPVGLDGTRPNL
jgi:hypothetical protein